MQNPMRGVSVAPSNILLRVLKRLFTSQSDIATSPSSKTDGAPSVESSRSSQPLIDRERLLSRHQFRNWLCRPSVPHLVPLPTDLQQAVAPVLRVIPKKTLRSAKEMMNIVIRKQMGLQTSEVETRRYADWLRSRILKKKTKTVQTGIPSSLPQLDPVIYNDMDALGYIAGTMPFVYAVERRILSDFHRRLPGFSPTTMLDFGTGVGTAIWAAHHTFDPKKMQTVVGIESSSPMMEVATRVFQANPELAQKINFRRFLRMTHKEVPAQNQYDLVTCAYSLHDLNGGEELQQRTALSLWRRCKGVLVIVEPGDLSGFEIVAKVRQRILDRHSGDPDPPIVIAPCAHNHTCPLLGSTTPCISEQHAIDPSSRLTRLTRQYERFAYVVICRKSVLDLPVPPETFQTVPFLHPEDRVGYPTASSSSQGPSEPTTVSSQPYLAKFLRHSFLYPRAFRPPLRRRTNKDAVIVDLCHADGMLRRHMLSRKKLSNTYDRALARRVRMGDQFAPALLRTEDAKPAVVRANLKKPSASDENNIRATLSSSSRRSSLANGDVVVLSPTLQKQSRAPSASSASSDPRTGQQQRLPWSPLDQLDQEHSRFMERKAREKMMARARRRGGAKAKTMKGPKSKGPSGGAKRRMGTLDKDLARSRKQRQRQNRKMMVANREHH